MADLVQTHVGVSQEADITWPLALHVAVSYLTVSRVTASHVA